MRLLTQLCGRRRFTAGENLLHILACTLREHMAIVRAVKAAMARLPPPGCTGTCIAASARGWPPLMSPGCRPRSRTHIIAIITSSFLKIPLTVAHHDLLATRRFPVGCPMLTLVKRLVSLARSRYSSGPFPPAIQIRLDPRATIMTGRDREGASIEVAQPTTHGRGSWRRMFQARSVSRARF